jgi:uncharacterized protein YkwD
MLFKTRILVASVALLLFFGVAAGASARGLSSPEYSVLRAMNAVRASHGLPRLRIDYRLESVARAHSVDMLRHQYFAHGAFSARVNASGAAGPIFGENLAFGPVSSSWVVNAWLASPEHRANLLRRGFRRVGIGAVIGTFEGSGGTFVVTADFAGT